MSHVIRGPLTVLPLFGVFFAVGCLGQQQCPSCDCFKVPTVGVTLKELVDESPLYLQAAASSSRGANLDSVCLNISDTPIPDNAFVQMVNSFTDNKPVLRRASIQTPILDTVGSFRAIGPTRTYNDFIIGNPCRGVYVIYRCTQTGTCVTDKSQVDVIVMSKRLRECQTCVDKGLDVIRETFPEVAMYPLPRKLDQPCLAH